MKIVSVYDVRGRGIVAVVEDAPKGIQVGVFVHQGTNAWRIRGIEYSVSMTTVRRIIGPLGLLLKAEEGCPERPENGELEL